ncbi:uncharacterized protein LOC128721828 [Anopheles nili]|uniref:uncharacterized protein LOC128721828 n=1 Tax=Anopheles nili TaxID=185578 RepID=UPI00237A39DF|nr:uncharacterized protein LOC128721828 [Anopheles nili]
MWSDRAVKLVSSLLPLLFVVAVLAGKDPAKPVDGVAIASTPSKSQPAVPAVPKKAPHGKREVGGYHHHHQRYSFGHSVQQPFGEFYAPATSHGSYSYSIPQHHAPSPLYGSFSSPKLYLGSPSLKYSSAPSLGASSHAFYSPLGHQHTAPFGGFADVGPAKYAGGFGSKDISELLKQLHAVGPLTIKAVPSSYAYGSFGDHGDSAGNPLLFDTSPFQLKPVTLKLHDFSNLPHAAALTAPAPFEPSYASGVKGLRHYAGPSHSSASELYTPGKYASVVSHQQPTTATMVSPLHTSVHSTLGHPKPFKPSTYLGSTHETISSPSTSHVQTYLAPSLQYLPPVGKGSHVHKLSYDSPAKHGYLPPPPPPPAPSTNAYLPPKPAHGYLPPVSSSGTGSNYIPLSTGSSSAPSSLGSHEDTLRKGHPHHGGEHSSESLEYSGATGASPTPTSVTPHYWKH